MTLVPLMSLHSAHMIVQCSLHAWKWLLIMESRKGVVAMERFASRTCYNGLNVFKRNSSILVLYSTFIGIKPILPTPPNQTNQATTRMMMPTKTLLSVMEKCIGQKWGLRARHLDEHTFLVLQKLEELKKGWKTIAMYANLCKKCHAYKRDGLSLPLRQPWKE